MKSIGQMIQELHEVGFTSGFKTEWEEGFVSNLYAVTKEGKDTTRVTEKQADKIIQLHTKHCT